MSLEKSIKNGSEHRKPYRKPKVIDKTCSNHWIIVNKVDNKREKIKKVLQIEQEIKGH